MAKDPRPGPLAAAGIAVGTIERLTEDSMLEDIIAPISSLRGEILDIWGRL